MKINREWHAAHKLPPTASMQQKAVWHVAHAEHCGCRGIPASVMKIIRSSHMSVPSKSLDGRVAKK